MKKQLIFAAAALALAACSNDEHMDNWAGEIRLSSSLSVQETNTRAATDVQDDAFLSGENVDVYISENQSAGQAAETVTTYAQPLTYTTGASGVMNIAQANQPYFPTSGNGVNIYAVYPSNVGTTFSINSDQSGDANYKASDLMYGTAANPVARTSSTVPVTFKHLLSKVTITLVAGSGLTDADLTDAKVTLLNVLPDVSFTASTGTIGTAEGTATPVVVKSATDANLSNSAIVVPQNLAANFVQVDLADGGTLTGSLNDGATPSLASGNEYTYTITVNLTALNIISEITPWTGNTGSGTATMQ